MSKPPSAIFLPARRSTRNRIAQSGSLARPRYSVLQGPSESAGPAHHHPPPRPASSTRARPHTFYLHTHALPLAFALPLALPLPTPTPTPTRIRALPLEHRHLFHSFIHSRSRTPPSPRSQAPGLFLPLPLPHTHTHTPRSHTHTSRAPPPLHGRPDLPPLPSASRPQARSGATHGSSGPLSSSKISVACWSSCSLCRSAARSSARLEHPKPCPRRMRNKSRGGKKKVPPRILTGPRAKIPG